MAFLDHFSGAAALYAASRPQYPQALFEFIAAAAPATARAWDCATGNGQAAAGLARHFDAVEASDASAEQIAHAVAHQRVRYSVQPAEATDFPAAYFDTITVAQALHWFDVPAFFCEARRVLRPDGLLVVSGYSWFTVDARFNAAFADAIHAPIGDSWPAQNALVWNHYRDIDFPFPRIDAPEITLQVDWTFQEMLAFVHSWSGTRRHIATHGREFFDDAERRLAPLWGRPGEHRRVTMPLTLIACQFTPARKTP